MESNHDLLTFSDSGEIMKEQHHEKLDILNSGGPNSSTQIQNSGESEESKKNAHTQPSGELWEHKKDQIE